MKELLTVFNDDRFKVESLVDNPFIGRVLFAPEFLADNSIKKGTSMPRPNDTVYSEVLGVILSDLSARLPRYQGLAFKVADVIYSGAIACVLVEHKSLSKETTLNNAFEPVEETKQLIKRDLLVCELIRITRQYSYKIKSIFDVTYKGDKSFLKARWNQRILKAFFTDNSLLDENPSTFNMAQHILPKLSNKPPRKEREPSVIKQQREQIKSNLNADIAKVKRNVSKKLQALEDEFQGLKEQELETSVLKVKQRLISLQKSTLKLKQSLAIKLLKQQAKQALKALKGNADSTQNEQVSVVADAGLADE